MYLNNNYDGLEASTSAASDGGIKEEEEKIPYQPSLASSDVIKDTFSGKLYKVVRFLGNGSFGECFLVDSSRKTLACKIQEKTWQSNKELKIFSSVDHKNIVKFIDSFKQSDKLYILMEYYDYTLDQLSMLRKVFTLYETRYFLKNIAEGVEYLHERQIIHRDLKHDNIMLDNRIRVKIGDFGCATYLKAQKIEHTFFNEFAAPELRAHIVRFACDVWALGVIAFELVFGAYPFVPEEFDDSQFEHTQADNFDFYYEDDESEELRNLLKAIFRKYTNRITATDILNAPFLSGTIPDELSNDIFSGPIDDK